MISWIPLYMCAKLSVHPRFKDALLFSESATTTEGKKEGHEIEVGSQFERREECICYQICKITTKKIKSWRIEINIIFFKLLTRDFRSFKSKFKFQIKFCPQLRQISFTKLASRILMILSFFIFFKIFSHLNKLAHNSSKIIHEISYVM